MEACEATAIDWSKKCLPAADVSVQMLEALLRYAPHLISLNLDGFELHIPQLGRGLAENLGFLYSAMGRFWFLILVAILAASGHGLWGIFTVILVVCTAVVNAVIWWKYPDYEKGCRIVDLGQA